MSGNGLVAGKVVLITGGGSGIGGATAQLCATEGAAAVMIADLDEQRARPVMEAVSAAGSEVAFLRTDVAEAAQVDAVVADVERRWGRLDCAVNSAGIAGAYARISDYTDEQWRAVLRVNLDGIFHSMRAELRAMMRSGGGSIVNISSGVQDRPTLGLGPYAGTKAAVVAMSKCAAGEYAAEGIRVNVVLPGPTRTPLFEASFVGQEQKLADLGARLPLGRLGTPDEVAQAIVWLCSPRASYIDGALINADGAIDSFSAE